jgi:hypothetical protein
MEQHPIPQNVTTFQFRLIGDMTPKQFLYLLGGAVAAFILYKLPLPIFFTLPLAITAAMMGFGFAFIPIEERPMDIWVLSFIKSIYAPTLFVWQREKNLNNPLSKISTAVTPADTTKTDAIIHPTTANPTTQTVKATTIPPIALTPTQSPPETVMPPNQPTTPSIVEQPKTTTQSKPETKSTPLPVTQAQPQTPPSPLKKHANTNKSFLSILLGWISPKPKIKNVIKPTVEAKSPPPTPQRPISNKTTTTSLPTMPTPVIMMEKTARKGFFAQLISAFGVKHKPIPPKMPTYTKPTPGTKELFNDLKTPQVVGTTLNVPGFNAPALSNTPPEPKQHDEPISNQATQTAQTEFAEKNQNLEQKLTNLEKELSTKNISESRVVELQQQLTEVLSERQRMEAELQILRNKVTQMQSTPPTTTQIAQTQIPEPNRGPSVKVITAETAIKSGMPQLTTFPNVVTGIIKDYNSNLLPGVLVTVRDHEGVPLRALKTNRLGQFAASTPLPNGTYLIEVEDPKNSYIFDRVQITINGNLVPAIEIIAKSQKQIEREKLEKAIFGGGV